MRSRRLSLLLALTLLPLLASGGETVRVLVQSSPLAGSQYYAASELWSQIRTGDRLELVREADNRHDRNAVRVEWKGRQLGYVPRAENRAVARALDAGEKLEARVSKLRQDPDPWRRVEFEVFLLL
ncbi:MAG TPA: HIRAN domain-containing protein [Candidatus Accumulibacter phosphatis]|nr:MAG: HIRAN domain protein [Candidatus Accumulibacter sp. SK-11]HAY29186.1 HIRAN protein [Accumulibacter sp.]HRL77977.1 HIRAN domain-containing protein [Candidatus Accumulibacter phosphatis]HCN67432.1 HIRAN protein [Accumulibacter sp.]HCV14124.1 HIRAN protein [Accumulibacter sp.]